MIDRSNLSSDDMQKDWSSTITKLTRELTETSSLYNQYYTKSMKIQSQLDEAQLDLSTASNSVKNLEKTFNDKLK